jgi:predicted RNA binding protein YcfA (HicA-like mRNA interferase family)
VGALPTLKPREVVALLESLGFAEVRQKGSHKQFRHADGRGTTVPFHPGRDVSPTLLRKIAKDIGLTAEQLIKAKGS